MSAQELFHLMERITWASAFLTWMWPQQGLSRVLLCNLTWRESSEVRCWESVPENEVETAEGSRGRHNSAAVGILECGCAEATLVSVGVS